MSWTKAVGPRNASRGIPTVGRLRYWLHPHQAPKYDADFIASEGRNALRLADPVSSRRLVAGGFLRTDWKRRRRSWSGSFALAGCGCAVLGRPRLPDAWIAPPEAWKPNEKRHCVSFSRLRYWLHSVQAPMYGPSFIASEGRSVPRCLTIDPADHRSCDATHTCASWRSNAGRNVASATRQSSHPCRLRRRQGWLKEPLNHIRPGNVARVQPLAIGQAPRTTVKEPVGQGRTLRA